MIETLEDVLADGIASGIQPAPKKRRKSSTSPTQRTLAECRKRGWVAQVVERYNAHARVLQDLFGVIDVVALAPTITRLDGKSGIIGIQAATGTNHASRREKILAEPRAKAWVESRGVLELWTWSLRGDRGKAKRWTLRVETYEQMVASAKSCPECDGPADHCADCGAPDGQKHTPGCSAAGSEAT